MPGRKGHPEKQHARRPGEYLVVGRVVRPHGVRGALLVEPLSRVIDSLKPGSQVYFGDSNQSAEMISSRYHQGRLMISLQGVNDRTQAEAFRDQELKIRTSQAAPLEKDEYYYWQIIGLQAVLESGEALGEIVDILETGANDVYIVRRLDGGDLLLPAIASVILKVDLDAGTITVHLLPGL